LKILIGQDCQEKKKILFSICKSKKLKNRFTNDKVSRHDIPGIKSKLERLSSGFNDLGPGNHLIFGHSGTMHLVMRKFGLVTLHIANCGAIAFQLNEKSKPSKLFKYWMPPEIDSQKELSEHSQE